MSGNLKQATLKKFGFTWRVEHRGEDIDVYIDKTGLFCPDGKQICQNKPGLTSHMNFKHGKFKNLASKTHGSVSPVDPTSVVAKDTSIEAPTNTTNTLSSSITTTVSSSADPSTSSTSSLNEGSTSSATIDLSSEEPKIKRM